MKITVPLSERSASSIGNPQTWRLHYRGRYSQNVHPERAAGSMGGPQHIALCARHSDTLCDIIVYPYKSLSMNDKFYKLWKNVRNMNWSPVYHNIFDSRLLIDFFEICRSVTTVGLI